MKERKISSLLVLLIAVIALIMIVMHNALPKYIKIDSEEAKEIIVNEGDFIIIDTRNEKEYKKGHIKDSILIPIDSISEEIDELVNSKNIILIVYGKDNDSSKKAAKILIKMGYKFVYDLGDIDNWKYNLES